MSEDEAADDDWFERAVAGEDAGATAEDADRSDDEQAEDAGADPESAGGGTDADAPDGEGGGVDVADPDHEDLDAAFEEAAAAVDADAGDGAAGGESTPEGAGDGPDDAAGESPFDDADGESPFDDAGGESPFDGGDAGGMDGGEDAFGDEAGEDAFDDEAGEDPFGDEAGEDPFGDAAGGDPFGDEGGGDLFEDDFASAFGAAGDDEGFDEGDFDSEIPRLDVGIGGLDRMIRGGVPRRHLMVAIGSAGTGKTTFGLQYLNHGLEHGENGVFITLEQSHESILDTAAEHGWDFAAYEDAGDLAVIDLDPIEMANSLDNIRGELPRLIEEFDADRFVLDSVSLLEMMYDDQARRRTEVYDFTRSLKRAGVTTLLTSEADEDNAYASRHGIIEYLTDAVFVLQYVRAENQETRLAVEIQKIRNANHSRETKPYEITDAGISVYEQANIF